MIRNLHIGSPFTDTKNLGSDKYAHKSLHMSQSLTAYLLTVLHVRSHQLRTLSVKATQHNGSHHHGDIVADAFQKAGTLECHIGRADNQRFARVVGQREEIIRRDGVRLGAFNLRRVARSLAGGNDEVVRGQCFGFGVFVCQLGKIEEIETLVYKRTVGHLNGNG